MYFCVCLSEGWGLILEMLYTSLNSAILLAHIRQPFWLRGDFLPQRDHCSCAHQYLKTGSVVSIEVHSLLLQATEETSVLEHTLDP